MAGFGHAVRRLTADEINRWVELDVTLEQRWPEHAHDRRFRYAVCRATKDCLGKITHEVSYCYVTGRRGRITTAEKRVCREHAEAFAAKHGIELVAV